MPPTIPTSQCYSEGVLIYNSEAPQFVAEGGVTFLGTFMTLAVLLGLGMGFILGKEYSKVIHREDQKLSDTIKP